VRKLISILVALGVVLSFSLVATPAAAVEEPVTVCLEEEIACVSDNYTIAFHNIGTLLAGDWIDVMFPVGTNTFFVSGVTVAKGAKMSSVLSTKCVCSGGTAIGGTYEIVNNLTVRITLGAGNNITKCDYVCITVNNVTNPASCNYHLEVGTTAHTPVDSEEYTIYCAKVALEGGKADPDTGLSPMNLISLPCYPDDESIEVVFKELFDEVEDTASTKTPFSFSVWYWDNENDTWLKYVSDSSFTDLDTIEPGKAYWVKPSTDITIKIHGDPYPPGQGPPLKWCYPRCWNMVGFASLVDMDAEVYLDYTRMIMNTGNYAVLAIWGWDAELQVYDPKDFDLNGSTGADDVLKPGEGYWMAFFEEACIIPPAQSTC
jgi:hypothetical protein